MAHHTSSNPNEFILPDLGEGVAEAELIKWRVTVGQTVKEHDILADMETDKALVEVPSPRGGTIASLNGAEGEIIKVGAVLVTFGTGASVEAKPAAKAPDTSHAPSKTPPGSKPGNVDNCDMGGQIAAGLPKTIPGAEHMNGSHGTAAPQADAGTVVGKVGGSLEGVTAEAGKALATPAVRRLARDLGVEIDSVHGTGIGGRVTDKDVRAAAGGGAPVAAPARTAPTPAPAPSRPAPAPVARPTPAPAPAPARQSDDAAIYAAASTRSTSAAPGAEETTRIPFRGVRRTIANRLHQSVSTAVHFTVMDEADVTQLESLRKKLAAASGEKVSFLPFVAAAVCRCLAGEFKEFNSTTDDEKSEIVRHRAVHIGIATDTENGLMVPVIRDCDKLGVLEIGRHIAHVAESARNRTAPREMLSGSTFTISNVGSHAGRFATPIINYPECGILAVGRARDGVVVNKGMLGVGKLLPLSLACDHRVVDGAQAALMLARIVEMLGNPESLLAPAR
ncbi:MAG: dihydrolipoamide acetyltransferase family protein [Phycisphaerales bacterium]